MSTLEYLQVLDWSARLTVANKRGSTPSEAPPVLERLGIDAAIFGVHVREFGKLFCNVAGKPKSVSDERSLKTRRRLYQRRPVQELAVTDQGRVLYGSERYRIDRLSNGPRP